MIAEAQIREDDVIVGSSLGGIVGCEIANQMRLRALVLIGSAQSPDEISKLLAVLHPLAALAPLKLVRAATEKLPGELCEMFAASDTNFVRTMCRAVFTWSGLRSERIRPCRLHGRHDRVIPAPADADLLLDGGHLVAMTHASECVSFLRSANL